MSKPTVLMFSGQGSQYYQMGQQLRNNDAVFREHLEALDETAASRLGFSVIEHLYHDELTPRHAFADPPTSNAAIVMVESALAATLSAKGIVPDVVLGASLGTFSGASVAGALTAEDAVRLVIDLGREIAAGVADGGMVAVLDRPELHQEDDVLRRNATLAGVNSARHFVLAAEKAELDRVNERLQHLGVTHQVLNAARPFHAESMDPAEQACKARLREQRFSAPQLPIVCCSLQLPVRALGPALLWQSMREPIQFADSIANLEAQGPHRYIDAGPAGSLAAMLNNSDQLVDGSSAETVMSPFGGGADRLRSLANTA